MLKLIFITIGLLVNLISNEVQSSLVFSNHQSLRNEKFSRDPKTSYEENLLSVSQVGDSKKTDEIFTNSSKSIKLNEKNNELAENSEISDSNFDSHYYSILNSHYSEENQLKEDNLDDEELERKFNPSNTDDSKNLRKNLQLRNNEFLSDLKNSSEENPLKIPQIIDLQTNEEISTTISSLSELNGEEKKSDVEGKNFDYHLHDNGENPNTLANLLQEGNHDDDEVGKKFEQSQNSYGQQSTPIYSMMHFNNYNTNLYPSLPDNQRSLSLQHINYLEEDQITDEHIIAHDDLKNSDDKKENNTTYSPFFDDQNNEKFVETNKQTDNYDQIQQYTTILAPKESINDYSQNSTFRVHKPVDQDQQIDYLDEAKNLAYKIGFKNSAKPMNDQEISKNFEELSVEKLENLKTNKNYKSSDVNNLNKEDIHEKSEIEINENGLIYPSVYQLYKNKTSQAALYATIANQNNSRFVMQSEKYVPLKTASSKVFNPLPKIIFAREHSFPSLDLLRRTCSIKINDFPIFGLCRPICSSKEIGIRIKLKDTCTYYQNACDSLELCCVPNLSEFKTCNFDLFKPNDILIKVEKALNLPQNSLIKLSQFPSSYIDAIVNYRPFYKLNEQINYANNFNAKKHGYYNISRPFINKNRIHKSSGDEFDSDNNLIKPNTQFESVSNHPVKYEMKFSKFLRRVDNPQPHIRKVYYARKDDF